MIQQTFVTLPRAKRFFDIFVSVTFFIFFAPVWFLIFFAMLIEQCVDASARGSFLYRESRFSRGKEFSFIKFRTIKKHALDRTFHTHGFIHTKPLEHHRKNLTRVGYLLKQIYLDELPQLWNVLRGDMTLVGPRAVNREVYDALIQRGVFTKTVITCGITGYYQIQKEHRRSSDRDADAWYIEYCRTKPWWRIVLLDIYILYKTVGVIFRAKGL